MVSFVKICLFLFICFQLNLFDKCFSFFLINTCTWWWKAMWKVSFPSHLHFQKFPSPRKLSLLDFSVLFQKYSRYTQACVHMYTHIRSFLLGPGCSVECTLFCTCFFINNRSWKAFSVNIYSLASFFLITI